MLVYDVERSTTKLPLVHLEMKLNHLESRPHYRYTRYVPSVDTCLNGFMRLDVKHQKSKNWQSRIENRPLLFDDRLPSGHGVPRIMCVSLAVPRQLRFI